MIEAVDARAKGLRPVRTAERVELTAYLRRLDWWLLLAVAGLLGYGLWAIGGITQNDIPGNANYFVVRQSVYAAVGVAGLLGAILIDPDAHGIAGDRDPCDHANGFIAELGLRKALL